MLVRDWMSTPVISVTLDNTVDDAGRLLSENHIRYLPVIQDGQLVGVVSDRDIKVSKNSPTVRIEEIMNRAPITVDKDITVQEAASVFLENWISGAPVVDKNRKPIGVFTQTDLNRFVMEISGLMRGGISWEFLTEDRPGSIKELTDILRSYGGRISSILISYARVQKGFRKVFIGARSLDRSQLDKMTEELRAKATLLYRLDHRDNRRDFFES